MEKMMISKLKLECGTNFTHKIETMFKDISISNQLNIELKPKMQDLIEYNSHSNS